MSSLPRVGYIGLGSAGYSMAACLAKKGYNLTVRDADPSPASRFVRQYPQCRVAAPGPEAFQECDVVITMLPNGDVVREVLLGENGIAKYLQPGKKKPKIVIFVRMVFDNIQGLL